MKLSTKSKFKRERQVKIKTKYLEILYIFGCLPSTEHVPTHT